MPARPAPENRSVVERREFGVINVDKPPGPTAHQVVSWVKEMLDVDRAAHAGTLDPKVTGCLPILVGDATRLAPAFLEGEKEYVTVLELHDTPPDRIETVLSRFEGEIYQKPPRKSAVARRLRTRRVHSLTALERQGRQCLLHIRCEPGTYIRKLCHDLGLVLGVGGHMGELRRTATDPFDDRDLVTLFDLIDAIEFAADGDSSELATILQPAERALTHLPVFTVAPNVADSVEHGSPIFSPGIIDAPALDPADEPLVVCKIPSGSAICLGRLVGDPEAEDGEIISLERVLI